MVWKITFKNIKTSSLLIQHETTTDGVKDRETREELFTHTHTHKTDLKILKQKLVDLLHVLNISTLNLYSGLTKPQNKPIKTFWYQKPGNRFAEN